MLSESTLSLVARRLREMLAAHIEGIEPGNVRIGTPLQVLEEADDGHRLCLFFHRVEFSSGEGEPEGSLRARCMVTAFGADATHDEGEPVSAGENDLRLLGAALRVLRTYPVLSFPDEAEPVAELHVAHRSTPLPELEHRWSMLGPGACFRASVDFDLTLVPLSPEEIERRRREPEPPWVPRLTLATPSGAALTWSVSVEDVPPVVDVWVTGEPQQPVRFEWELLVDGSEQGWTSRSVGVPLQLDEEGKGAVVLDLPLGGAGQALLRAERIDEPSLRSPPLLVSVVMPAP